MLPRYATNNIPDAGRADGVVSGNRRPALPLRVTAPNHADIIIGQCGAMVLLSLAGSHQSALSLGIQRVVERRSLKQMGGANAGRVVAVVERIKSSGERCAVDFERCVGSPYLPFTATAKPYDTVSTELARTSPHPAGAKLGADDGAILVDFGPETNSQRVNFLKPASAVAELPGTGWASRIHGLSARCTLRRRQHLRRRALAGLRAETARTVLVRLATDRNATAFTQRARIIRLHRDLPLVRNRGARPGPVDAGCGATSCPDFTTPTRRKS